MLVSKPVKEQLALFLEARRRSSASN